MVKKISMLNQSVITDEMRATIGVKSEALICVVEKGAIIRFAEAIGDPNPLYYDQQASLQTRCGDIIAPPTFLRSTRPSPAEPVFPIPYSGVLDGGSDWEYFEPVCPGDILAVTIRILDIFERQGSLGNMLFIVRENRYVNQLNAMVAIEKDTEIYYNESERERY